MNGILEEIDQDVIKPTDTHQIVNEIIPAESWKQLEDNRDLDFTYVITAFLDSGLIPSINVVN